MYVCVCVCVCVCFPVNGSEPKFTREVYVHCCPQIQGWIDVAGMQGQLMKHGIVTTDDDFHGITEGSPTSKRNYLFCKLCGMRDGFSLLYRCLRESQDMYLGHKDAADVLEKRGEGSTVYLPSLSLSLLYALIPSLSLSLPSSFPHSPSLSLPTSLTHTHNSPSIFPYFLFHILYSHPLSLSPTLPQY